ncbi:MAG: Fe-Mn family superoxide dismutase [Alphaproteobacteria bacterium]|jgi:Fe-Mn family superoxide dismutase
MLTQPDLPYTMNALAPHMSEQTFEFHYGKHHATYVTNANNLIKDTPMADKSLEDIIKSSEGGLFNNAAQIWNHSFFWNSMTPDGGGQPSGDLGARIDADFGSFDKFAEAFQAAAVTQFGSGWAWLVEDGGKLAVCQTANANTPLTDGKKPLLTVDVWEHAYYLDYQNRRPDFVKTFLNSLANWDFVEANLAG